MTIPVIRKRAKKPKTRTGCRTCRARHVKCDEAKPDCLRCTKSGRSCAGYDSFATASLSSSSASSPSSSRDSACALILPRIAARPPELSNIPRSPLTITVDLSSEEGSAFDFFRRESLHQLPGNSWTLSWDRLVSQSCGRDPAITHAAIAVGSLHRALIERSMNGGCGNGQVPVQVTRKYQLALDQCNKAMCAIRQHIKTLEHGCTDGDVEIVLLVSLLFLCFEILHGEDKRATMHFRTGIQILYERLRDRAIAPSCDGKRVVELKVQPRTSLEVLTQTFVRLDHDFVMSAEDQYYLHPIIQSEMPRSFTSFNEAMVYLDIIYVEIAEFDNNYMVYAREKLTDYDIAALPAGCPVEWSKCLAIARARTEDLADRPDLIAAIEKCQQMLRQWMSALAFIPVSPDREITHLLVQMQFFYAWIQAETALDQNPMSVDRFGDQFEHMVGILERYSILQGVNLDDGYPHPSISTSISSTMSTMTSISSSPILGHSSQSWDPFSGQTQPLASDQQPSPSDTTKPFVPLGHVNSPAFCLGTGMIPCLSTIMFCSRSSALRRRCLRLCRAINMSGVFCSAWLAALFETVTTIEERAARILLGRDPDTDTRDLMPYEIPARARILEIDLEEWETKKDVTPEFYKEDSGSMVYAYYDVNGQVQVTCATFDVVRPSSASSPLSTTLAMENSRDWTHRLSPEELQMIVNAGYGSDE